MTTEATPGTSLAGVLSLQYQFTASTFRLNVKGVSHAESLQAPGEAGNCLNWIAGHIVSARNGILGLLDLPPVRPREQMTRYLRGSDRLTDPAGAIDFAELLSDFDKSQDKLVEALARVTPEKLAEPLPPDRNPFQVDNLGEMLATLAFHESYHVGQLGVVRRLIGKEPGIR